MKENIYLVVFIVFVILNIFISFKLFRDDYYEKKQKIIQFLIVWLIPIIGVFLVYIFLKRNDKIETNSYGGGIGVEAGGIVENTFSNFESSSDSGGSGGGD